MAEIIVEFPSPLTEREKKLIYGYKGEIVRCKDCKHNYYDGNQLICQKLYWCDCNNFEPSAEDFCSHGERREE